MSPVVVDNSYKPPIFVSTVSSGHVSSCGLSETSKIQPTLVKLRTTYQNHVVTVSFDKSLILRDHQKWLVVLEALFT